MLKTMLSRPFEKMASSCISWEIELTSRCNSRCVGCSRYSEYYYDNPYFASNKNLRLDVFRKAISSTPQLEFVLFCGNYGDPLLHPQIFEVLEILCEEFPRVRRMIHTNGSFGSESFWQKMATYFETPGSYIKFSIDGLKQSHERFRRGTNWDLIQRNAKIFIESKGRAVWKMIEFDHNRHEIEEARALAETRGFRKFELRKNNYPGLDIPILNNPSLEAIPATVTTDKRSIEQLKIWNQQQIQEKTFDHIECRSVSAKNLYLDVEGSVWPCCWMGGLPYRPEHELRQWFQNEFMKSTTEGFNSLSDLSLEGILRDPWFSQHLPESWNLETRSEDHPLASTCVKTCGKCKEATPV